MSSIFHRNIFSLNTELILGSNSSLFEAWTAGRGDWQLEFSTLSGFGNGLGLRQVDWEQGSLSGESPSKSVCEAYGFYAAAVVLFGHIRVFL